MCIVIFMMKTRTDAMHVVKVVSRQKGREYVSYLLRNSYREGGKVRKQTLANLSHLPEPLIELIRDWLLARQARIERSLARRHLSDGSLVLYDLTSTYVEGSCCALAAHGHSRDQRPDRAQIEFGLVTDARGCPIAVEAFAGNTADPATVEAQIEKLRERFGLTDVVLVGDRGMLTSARIERLKEVGGIAGARSQLAQPIPPTSLR